MHVNQNKKQNVKKDIKNWSLIKKKFKSNFKSFVSFLGKDYIINTSCNIWMSHPLCWCHFHQHVKPRWHHCWNVLTNMLLLEINTNKHTSWASNTLTCFSFSFSFHILFDLLMKIRKCSKVTHVGASHIQKHLYI